MTRGREVYGEEKFLLDGFPRTAAQAELLVDTTDVRLAVNMHLREDVSPFGDKVETETNLQQELYIQYLGHDLDLLRMEIAASYGGFSRSCAQMHFKGRIVGAGANQNRKILLLSTFSQSCWSHSVDHAVVCHAGASCKMLGEANLLRVWEELQCCQHRFWSYWAISCCMHAPSPSTSELYTQASD